LKLHLAGLESSFDLVKQFKPKYQLGSFLAYSKSKESQFDEIKDTCEHYILDSGAHTLQQGKGVKDFDAYLDRYIEFVKSHNWINQYVELDIDNIVGTGKVELWRDKLEAEIGRAPIVVWHKERGESKWYELIESYKYVGIPCLKIDATEQYWNRFLLTAHDAGCKVHGFGMSDNSKLPRYDFDTCDSSSWVGGSRFGVRYRFKGSIIEIYREDGYLEGGKPYVKEMDKTNMQEWIKFQNYIEELWTKKHDNHHGFW